MNRFFRVIWILAFASPVYLFTLPAALFAQETQIKKEIITLPPGLRSFGHTISIGARSDDVVRLWGRPDAEGKDGDLEYCKEGFSVHLSQRLVISFKVFFNRPPKTFNSSNASTEKGIGANSTPSDVLKAYGLPRLEKTQGDLRQMIYPFGVFYFEKESLQAISVGLPPE